MTSRLLTSVALLCATLAWVGWVYLHTIGDPARSEDIATAVLSDEASSAQLASSFALQIVRASGIDRSNIDLVEGSVAAALSDPRVTTNVISALGAAHANALGIDDDRSTTIDTNAMVAAVRERLAVVSPEIAVQLPDGVVPEITLPTFHPPGVSSLRTAAEAATTLLAIVAAVLMAVAFAFGDRRGVLRRAGIWGVCSGALWALVPIGVVAAARAWASDVDAIVEVATRESTSGVMPVAIALVLGGIVAVVLSFVPNLWPETSEVQRRGSVVRSSPRRPAPAYAPRINPAGHPSAGGVAGSSADPYSQMTPAPTARVDTYVPSESGYQTHVESAPIQQPAPPPAPQPEHDVDPWSTYFGPDTKA